MDNQKVQRLNSMKNWRFPCLYGSLVVDEVFDSRLEISYDALAISSAYELGTRSSLKKHQLNLVVAAQSAKQTTRKNA